MQYDKKKVETILSFMLKSKLEMGLQEAASFASSYAWLIQYLEYCEKGAGSPKEIKEMSKDGSNES